MSVSRLLARWRDGGGLAPSSASADAVTGPVGPSTGPFQPGAGPT
jgi:hypothetical protein